ncbi:MAG TPA: aminotransferase class I/II-fold pyridoxal phosphate-dependent enzyme, partial [Coxiellaceae bacterium]|nr:aminotransferase class I/II-fold pyridoxal phosphate-dependent enzyme [Coxiellaceae bacterium]
MQDILLQRLEKQKHHQRWRERYALTPRATTEINYHGKNYLSFSSNDYLGLASHPEVIGALQKAAADYGVGSTSSALIAGYSTLHQELEMAFADYVGRDRAIFFGNGYMANLGVITALIQSRSDVIYQDKLNHASLIDAALLSKAQLLRYPHHQLNELAALLQQPTEGLRLIASESVFSMDGSQADLTQLAALAKTQQSLLM